MQMTLKIVYRIYRSLAKVLNCSVFSWFKKCRVCFPVYLFIHIYIFIIHNLFFISLISVMYVNSKHWNAGRGAHARTCFQARSVLILWALTVDKSTQWMRVKWGASEYRSILGIDLYGCVLLSARMYNVFNNMFI